MTTPDITIISADEWPPVLELFDRCNRTDGIVLPVTLDADPLPTLVAARIGETVVGGAAMYGYFEIEAVIAVDPAWRRRGIGRCLITQIGQWARARGGSWVALADEAGPAVAGFATALGLQRLHGEIQLALDAALLPPLPPLPEAWQTRLAETNDAAAISAIIADAFGDPAEQVAAFVADRIANPVHRFVIGEIAGIPVAAMRLLRSAQGITITTFGVRRDQQGRGYGRLFLLTTLYRLLAAGYHDIRIEVEETNKPAYNLYCACGFTPQRRYGVYGLTPT
ncbi:GNAT family N-acetyltransferase [uncultured Chloroflexus sp.]|uniref:GNAT family N-acetyltransferase n=1 Tax=uncultured Chloroflexus sp. TaxID=214040 RepID=UPI00260562E0|nr:GNAT family N-acetyltransferase [uncultured Chloroflexus sp.]